MTKGDHLFALALSGGNALGAYHAGAYQALHEQALEPDWVAGASAGAINGALICGNPAEQRLARLAEFWRPAQADALGLPPFPDEARRTAAATMTLATGRPDAFLPRQLLGPWWNPVGNPEPSSLYDTAPLGRTLERLVDFDLLNPGRPRFSLTAVDVESGEDIVFETGRHRIGPEHLRASSALIPAFPPVELDGRLLGDAGMSANLPLDVVLSRPPDRPLLCLALDLLPLRGARPRTLGDTIARMQDLMFATQSRRAIAAWQAIFDARGRDAPAVTLLYLSYADQEREVSGKAFDFSPVSAAQRWSAGRRDVARALAQLRAGELAIGEPGLTVYMPDPDEPPDASTLRRVRPGIKPVEG